MLIVLVECTELLRQVGGISMFTYNTTLLLHRGHCHVLPTRLGRGDVGLVIRIPFYQDAVLLVTHRPTHRPFTA